MSTREVVQYYTELHNHYLAIWGAARHLGIHYGYYDGNHRTHAAAVVNMNGVLAARAGIVADENVLDAGCGIGGSGIWLGKNVGARVTGISITPRQIETAKTLARRNGLADRLTFRVADFLHTPFDDQSFNIVWGLESVCYAQRKKDFIIEAYRLLKPGGRIVVADGWERSFVMNDKEAGVMRGWLDAWAVPNLSTAENFSRDLAAAGFRHVRYQDITPQVIPSSRYMYNLYRWFSPLGYTLGRLGAWSPRQIKNMVGTYYQYVALQQGLWKYGIFIAEK